ncbi:MAG: hypothetical protein ACRDJM_05380, partial [Actinomycetota bacterium]
MSPRRPPPSRGTRAFFRQVAEELPGHLPPAHRSYRTEQWGRFFKLWYGERKEQHFEVQFLRDGSLEVAFHMEGDAESNAATGALLESKAAAIRAALGKQAEFASHGPRWRALREVWRDGDLRGEEAATEAASRLAAYVVALRPLLSATTIPTAAKAPA